MPNPFTVGESLLGGLDLVGLVDAIPLPDFVMPDVRPALDDIFESFRTTTLIGGVEVDVVRLPAGGGGLPIQAAAHVEETRPRFAFRRDQVDSLPAGSTFVIADGPDAGTWRVERDDRGLWDEVLTVVARRV